MFKAAAAILVVVVTAATPAWQSERIDQDVNARIRTEGDKNSQILKTLHYLTDLHGPRLTGSPRCRTADTIAATAADILRSRPAGGVSSRSTAFTLAEEIIFITLRFC